MSSFLEEIAEPRATIDRCDAEIIDRLAGFSKTKLPKNWEELQQTIIDILKKREVAVRKVFFLKKRYREEILQPKREEEKKAHFLAAVQEKGVDLPFAEWVIESLLTESKKLQQQWGKEEIKNK